MYNMQKKGLLCTISNNWKPLYIYNGNKYRAKCLCFHTTKNGRFPVKIWQETRTKTAQGKIRRRKPVTWRRPERYTH